MPGILLVGLAKPDDTPVPGTEFALTPPFAPAVVFANGAPDVYGKCPVPAAVPERLFVGLANPDETPAPVGRTDFTTTPSSEPAVAFKNATPDVYGKCPVPVTVPCGLFVGLAKPDEAPVPVG